MRARATRRAAAGPQLGVSVPGHDVMVGESALFAAGTR